MAIKVNARAAIINAANPAITSVSFMCFITLLGNAVDFVHLLPQGDKVVKPANAEKTGGE